MKPRDQQTIGQRIQQTIGQRIALTLVLVLAILFMLAFIGWISGGWDTPAAEDIRPSKFDDRLAALDREAIDNAYRTKIEQLFSVWLKDDTDQPRRAVNGARAARKAYIGAMTEIEKRERVK